MNVVLGYVAHCFDLLIEDIFYIDEISEFICQARFIRTFIKSHKYVTAEIKRVIARSGKI